MAWAMYARVVTRDEDADARSHTKSARSFEIADGRTCGRGTRAEVEPDELQLTEGDRAEQYASGRVKDAAAQDGMTIGASRTNSTARHITPPAAMQRTESRTVCRPKTPRGSK